jgi:hypothetical protein
MNFGGEWGGWCKAECSPLLNPYAYWGFSAKAFYDFQSLSGESLESAHKTHPSSVIESIYNPAIQYCDARKTNLEDAPEEAKRKLYLLKLRAQGVTKENNINNSKLFSSVDSWKYKCFPESLASDFGTDYIQPESPYAVHLNRDINTSRWTSSGISEKSIMAGYGKSDSPGTSLTTNNYHYHKPIYPYRTWACYHNDEQKYVVMNGSMPETAANFYSGSRLTTPYVWGRVGIESIFQVVDIDTQELVRANEYINTMSVGTIGSGEETIDVLYGPSHHLVSRANWTVNPWFGVYSTYDDKKPSPKFGYYCQRFPIDPTMTGAGGYSLQVPSNVYTVVRGSYDSYTYDEPLNKFPIVIARRDSDNAWVTGKWQTNVTIQK